MINPYENNTPEKVQEYNDWLRSKSEKVRKAGEEYPPWQVYLLTSSNHFVVLDSIDEQKDGGISFTVAVLKELNPHIAFERRVFGIKAEDLVPVPKEDWEMIFKPSIENTPPYKPENSN